MHSNIQEKKKKEKEKVNNNHTPLHFKNEQISVVILKLS